MMAQQSCILYAYTISPVSYQHCLDVDSPVVHTLRLISVSAIQAVELLSKAKGVSMINDRVNNRFPTPLDASHQDDVYVGRVRRDISRSDSHGLDLFVCGDQIKKGAALNAVQIAELLL
jgi:aspartate-semialdehyde dehydrogenase